MPLFIRWISHTHYPAIQHQLEVLYFFGTLYLLFEERLIRPCSHTGDMRNSAHKHCLFFSTFNSERHLYKRFEMKYYLAPRPARDNALFYPKTSGCVCVVVIKAAEWQVCFWGPIGKLYPEERVESRILLTPRPLPPVTTYLSK